MLSRGCYHASEFHRAMKEICGVITSNKLSDENPKLLNWIFSFCN